MLAVEVYLDTYVLPIDSRAKHVLLKLTFFYNVNKISLFSLNNFQNNNLNSCKIFRIYINIYFFFSNCKHYFGAQQVYQLVCKYAYFKLHLSKLSSFQAEGLNNLENGCLKNIFFNI